MGSTVLTQGSHLYSWMHCTIRCTTAFIRPCTERSATAAVVGFNCSRFDPGSTQVAGALGRNKCTRKRWGLLNFFNTHALQL